MIKNLQLFFVIGLFIGGFLFSYNRVYASTNISFNTQTDGSVFTSGYGVVFNSSYNLSNVQGKQAQAIALGGCSDTGFVHVILTDDDHSIEYDDIPAPTCSVIQEPYAYNLSPFFNISPTTTTFSISLQNWNHGTPPPDDQGDVWTQSTLHDGIGNSLMYYSLTASQNFPSNLLNPQIQFATSSVDVYCSGSFSTSSLTAEITSGISNAACIAGVFLFIPSSNSVSNLSLTVSYVQTKIPFSYFYDLSNIANNLTASSSTNLPTWSIDFSSVNLGSSTSLGALYPSRIEFFSTSIISRYLPDPLRLSFLALQAAAIFFALLIHIYHRIIPHKPTL